MTVRTFLAGALALLVAVQVVRSAAVEALGDVDPERAAELWRSHPDVQLSLGMTGIAAAAREGKPVPTGVFGTIYGASRKAPLAPEPFLVRGVQAQLSGDNALAERAFVQAKARDGRSLPARYFLADHYLRQRDAARGLREIAGLARLTPGGVTNLAPYVAQYARDPTNRAQLRALFAAEPALEDTSLSILAMDPRNAGLVLSLANPGRRNASSPWLPHLLASLIRDGQYSRARQVWADLSGVRLSPRELIFDPQFTRKDEPAPFNWSLTSSAIGLAERQRGGGLHVIFYGQQEGPLASQLLVLPAGKYRLTTKAAGADQAESLRWSLLCATTNQLISTVRLDKAVREGWSFTVPPTCPAQRARVRRTRLRLTSAGRCDGPVGEPYCRAAEWLARFARRSRRFTCSCA